MQYRLYPNTYENCKRCSTTVNDEKNAVTELKIGDRTDIESELYNISRPYTNCSNGKYGGCATSDNKEGCVKKPLPKNYTFIPPTLCRVVESNLKKTTDTGIDESKLAKMDCSV
jgi:hypothetical protein